jgi:hypothetical protein
MQACFKRGDMIVGAEAPYRYPTKQSPNNANWQQLTLL